MPVTRRRALLVPVAAASVLLLPRVVRAQQATPAATVAALPGMQELRITITDTGFDAPTEARAGLTLLTVANAMTGGDPAAANLILPPEGFGMADVVALFSPPSGTPEAEGVVPDWAYRAVWAGAPAVPAGQAVQGIVNLTPGEWIVANDSPGVAQQPAALRVTGEAAASPAAGAGPQADVAVEFKEYAFTGLENGAPAGPHLWRFTNTGQQPHIMLLVRAPGPVTMQQVMALLQMPEGATPPPDLGIDPNGFAFDNPGVAGLSPGNTSWVMMDLRPGTYVALCFIPDRQTGAPHALMGMVGIFTVGQGQAATPAA